MKRIVLTVLAVLLIAATAGAETAEYITKKCEFKVTEQSADPVHDDNIKTGWTPQKKNAELRIKLPKDGAGYLEIEWDFEPKDYSIIQYNSDGKKIKTDKSKNIEPAIIQYFPLEEETRYIAIRTETPGQEIDDVRILSRGTLSKDVQQWEFCSKCDLMLISTHQDDEWLWFGGLMPYYQYVRDKEVQVVYTVNCGRRRRKYALNGLWTGGIRNYPCFLNLQDGNNGSLTESLELWGGEKPALNLLVAAIRKYKPEVIVTHDINGEYGHVQHILTSKLVEKAIKAAADPKQFPKSKKAFGTWQVKKLYRHLEEKNQIVFEWDTPYEELYGYTPLKIAEKAFACHKTQTKYYSVNNHGLHDNAVFGLSYSTVGEDVLHNDFFENIEETPGLTSFPTEPLI